MGHPLAPGIGAAPLCAPPKIKRSMFVWGTLTLPAQGLRLSALPLRKRGAYLCGSPSPSRHRGCVSLHSPLYVEEIDANTCEGIGCDAWTFEMGQNRPSGNVP